VTGQDPTLDDDALPRCCRAAYRADLLEGRVPEDLRPLDPSGRYVQCANCVPASRNVPPRAVAPPRPYVPTTWVVQMTDSANSGPA
jgi:hypothetical protein